VIDCAIHPQMEDPNTLREYMPRAWQEHSIPGPSRYYYPCPFDEFQRDGDHPMGTDPKRVAALVKQQRASAAVLLPFTRGLLPDLDLANEVCTATNRWLAERWLESSDARPAVIWGSIRVNPGDPVRAVAEIDRWASHPRMVQVLVPMQAHHPYGHRMYEPVWRAAANHSLPVAVMADGGAGVEFFPTAAGWCRHFVEYSILYPLTFTQHLASLIAEGVLDRWPELRIVFVDGGADLLKPLIWRADKDWRGTLIETPWLKMHPGEYVERSVRFCLTGLEGPRTVADAARWSNVSRLASLLIWATRFPRWDADLNSRALAAWPEEAKRLIAVDNPTRLYSRLGVADMPAGELPVV
jgi:uncharacterized protein